MRTRTSSQQRRSFVQCTARSGVKGDSDDGVQAQQHGAFEVVGLAILDGICDDEDRYSKRNGFDCNMSS